MGSKNLNYVYTYKSCDKVIYVGIGTGPSFQRALDIKGHKRVYEKYGKDLKVEIVATELSRQVALKVEGAIGLALGESVMNSSKVLVRPAVIVANERMSGPRTFRDFFNQTAGKMAMMRRNKDAEGIRELNRSYLKMLYSLWLKSRKLDPSDKRVRSSHREEFLKKPIFELKRKKGVFGKVLVVDRKVWNSLGGTSKTIPLPKEVKQELAKLKRRIKEISDKTLKRRVAGLRKLSKKYPVLSKNVEKWIRKHDLGRFVVTENRHD